MFFYQITESISDMQWIKDGRFQYPGVDIDIYSVKFQLFAMGDNIVWKIAPGNKKIWLQMKHDYDLNFTTDIAPELEQGVYKLLGILSNYQHDITPPRPLVGRQTQKAKSAYYQDLNAYQKNARRSIVRLHNAYSLYGNTSKAVKLYRTWTKPPQGWTTEILDSPRNRGILYKREE